MKKDIFIKIAIIMMCWATMTDGVITPISVNIMDSFPNMSNAQFNFILTGSMLVSIPAAIICGKAAQYIGKKKILIFAYCLFLIAGLAPIFFHSLAVLILCRGLVGISLGCLGACVFSLIAELYKDERTSSTLMGVYNAMAGIAGIIISTAAGFLALVDWRHAFYTNAVGIISLLLIIFFLPSVPPEGKSTVSSGHKEKMPLRVWFYVLSTAIYCALAMPTFYFVAVYVAEMGGNSAIAGILSSLLTGGSFFAGIGFGLIFNKLKLYTEPSFYFVTAAAMALMFLTGNIVIAGILIFVVGLGYGTCLPYYYMVATLYAPDSKKAVASGSVNAALGLGCFGCTYIVVFCQTVLHLELMKSVFLFCGIIMAIIGIFVVLLAKHYTGIDRKASTAEMEA